MNERWVLQLCHCHYGPFADVARQWSALFHGTNIRVTTVYLTGQRDDAVAERSACDEVEFLEFSSAQVGGLKIKAVRRLRDLLRRHPYETIIAHRFKPVYIACISSRLPVIGVHHAFGDYDRLSRQLLARWFRQRLNLVGVSDAVRDNIRRSLPFMSDQVHTLHNRIDVAAVRSELVSRQSARERLGLPEDAWVVGNVGRLHRDKDQSTLIRGFAKALPSLPNGALLVIVGSGPLESALKAEARGLNIDDSVRFAGQVPEARRYFAAFDLFALTSDHEPFGMVLLEAMAASVPVIACASGGAQEVIDRPEAQFALGDDSALASRLVEHGALGPTELRTIIEHQNAWLNERFSDQAARTRFFGAGPGQAL